MEYKKTQSEIKTSSEYRSAGAEFSSTGKEYFDSFEEYKSVAKEIHFEGEEISEEAPQEDKKSKRRMLSKKVRQMGYLVAASAAVVMVSQTVPESNSGNIWGDGYYVDYDNIWVDGEANDFSSDDSGDSYQDESLVGFEDIEGLIHIDDFNFSGIANGGVFPVNGNGDWRLVDYEGNVVAGGNGQYHNLFDNPNGLGYTTLQNISDRYWVMLDANGQEVYRNDFPSGSSNCIITDENIIYLSEYDPDADKIYMEYRTLDGTVLCDSKYIRPYDLTYEFDYPFMDGVAVFTAINEEKDEYETYSLSKNGILRTLSTEYLAGSGNVDGYYLSPRREHSWLDIGHFSFSGGSIFLVDSTTGLPVGELDSDYFLTNVLGLEVENIYRSISFRGYYKEGVKCFNKGTYICINVYDSMTEESFDVLINYSDVNGEGKVNKTIAVYDEIVFDDYEYLCVRDGDAYYYIDWSGSVINGPFQKATAFTDDGYAMVSDIYNNIGVFDSDFMLEENYEDFDFIERYGDVFMLRKDVNGSYEWYMHVPGNK